MSDNRTSLEASAAGSGSGAAIATTTSATDSSSTANTTATTAKEAGEGSFADDRRTGRRRSDRIILASNATQQAVDRASTVARSNSTLLILGPGGSGRQHFARAIHAWSQRASGPLVHLSAGGTPESLQPREIFGATPEADPLGDEAPDGAEGALARAADGSLVIERVDLLAAPVRQKLIQALRDGSYRREGGADSIPLRVRVIATAEIGAEQTLGDLAVQTLPLPALSERKEDILPLAAHFLAEFADDEGLTAVGFTVDARRWLIEEPWVGNVRELRERIRQAVRLSGSGSVSAEALMLSTEGDEVPSFKEAKRAFETRYVEGLLRRCSGNISRAARLAKKDRKDFYDVIRRTGVDPAQFRS
jgi:two-component system response regulator GlrR